MLTTLLHLIRDVRAATAVEYGLIAALIAVAVISALTLVGANLSTTFHNIAVKL